MFHFSARLSLFLLCIRRTKVSRRLRFPYYLDPLHDSGSYYWRLFYSSGIFLIYTIGVARREAKRRVNRAHARRWWTEASVLVCSGIGFETCMDSVVQVVLKIVSEQTKGTWCGGHLFTVRAMSLDLSKVKQKKNKSKFQFLNPQYPSTTYVLLANLKG